MSGPFTDWLNAGFGAELLPIIPPGASLTSKTGLVDEDRGKTPGLPYEGGAWGGFPRWAQAEPNPKQYAYWNTLVAKYGAGVGLQGRQYPAVDVDVLDAALSAQIVLLSNAMLGQAPERVGRAPKALLPYRLAPGEEPFSKRRVEFFMPGDETKHAVEILARGQQYVVEGTHPGTGKPYAWTGGSPVQGGAANLSPVTADQVDKFLDEMVKVVEAAGGVIHHRGQHSDDGALNVNQGGLVGDVGMVRDALRAMGNNITDYSDWITMCAAIKAALNGDEAHYAVFETWNLQHPGNSREEIRQKWDSLQPPYRVGADYLYNAAANAGWTGYAQAVFTALGPMSADDQAANDNTGGARHRRQLALEDEWESPADWVGIPTPPRRWLVPDWLPLGHVTALFGPGGVGKSLLAQQLVSAVASGRAFLGVPVAAPGPVIAIYCEDESDELHRRQVGICGVLGIQKSDLWQVRHQARAGRDNALARINREGELSATALFDRLKAQARKAGAKLLVIDNVAQVFHGNENSRAEVTAFANLLTGLARDCDCAVLLLGHPSKVEGSKYSGSTAWDAAVRSRLYFGRPVEADRDEATANALADMRVLERSKSNYAASGEQLHVRWVGGAFVVQGGVGSMNPVAMAEELARQHREDLAFMDGLDDLASQGLYASASINSTAYYVKSLAKHSPAVAAVGMSGKRIEASAVRLLRAGCIMVGDAGKSAQRKPREGYVKTGKALPSAPAVPLEQVLAAPFECADSVSAASAQGCAGLPLKAPENLAQGRARSVSYTYGIEAGAQGAQPTSGDQWSAHRAAERAGTIEELEAALRNG